MSKLPSMDEFSGAMPLDALPFPLDRASARAVALPASVSTEGKYPAALRIAAPVLASIVLWSGIATLLF